MNTAILLLGLLVVGLAILLPLLLKAKGQQSNARFRQIKPLTEPEQILYWRLVEALPECVILSQVTFSRFLRVDVPRGSSGNEHRSGQNKIAQKSADFLVCLKDFTVVAAVELDDSTHTAKADIARNSLLATAGITVLRVHVKDIPSTDKLREMFAA